MGHEFRNFSLIDQKLFELVKVVIIEDSYDLLKFLLEKLAIGLSHLLGGALEVGDI